MFKSQPIIGWDIGGAHLKAVLLDTKGQVINSLQLACPLWKGLDYLDHALDNAMQVFKIAPFKASHAITMTGEMVDLFESRYEGVCKIAQFVSQKLGENTSFYAAAIETINGDNEQKNQYNFVNAIDVPRFASVIASVNWHASATFLASYVTNALLIDIGSTTSDVIPIIDGHLELSGNSDAARLKSDTLVYTGVIRTPIMALAQKLPFFDGDNHIEMNVMAEYFATTADVYRLTGELNAQFDLADTPDSKGKTPLESARRLARMIGYDVHNNIEQWVKLAFSCKALQMQQLKTAVIQHLKPNMIIIGAGVGTFLAQQIAADLQVDYLPITDIIQPVNQNNVEIEAYLPAYAVANLWHKIYIKKHTELHALQSLVKVILKNVVKTNIKNHAA